ncbi:glycosyltransferase family 2 protein [Paraclostridium sordellii]|uniref:glycosyltransferase family 2 protein n=1 Tax=Paraclostridium sordellii TaxID=1505 RepID=UPI00070EF93C|nr:glycosyltransferase family 2 protein [Paeniclostridium sordellii]
MNRKSIICSIISYNPEIKKLNENIESIVKQVDSIIIVDNGSSNIEDIEKLVQILLKDDYRIYLIKINENKGIASALNKAVEYAIDKNYEWILTLDQDSICDENLISEFIAKYKYIEDKKKIGIIAPNVICRGFDQQEYNNETEYILTAITSGCLTNVKACEEVGFFTEKLFIDHVDYDLCFKLNLKKYRIIKVNTAKIYHELGNVTVKKLLGKKIIVGNHNAIRRYYYYRNLVYMHKQYRKKYPDWIKLEIKSSIKVFIYIILFEKNKINKIQNILHGLYNGTKGRYGPK